MPQRRCFNTVREQLCEGCGDSDRRRPTVEDVAGELAVGVRSHRNRLKEEGTTFSALLDRARREPVFSLMEDPTLSLCDMAFLLGFSEQGSFNHAFRRWTGSTPEAYRQERL